MFNTEVSVTVFPHLSHLLDNAGCVICSRY